LVTTFWGLIVAIPALAGYAALRGRLDASLAEAISEAETLLEKFRPGTQAETKTMKIAREDASS
jgi:biopolymer transport protein ExbB/TolQ